MGIIGISKKLHIDLVSDHQVGAASQHPGYNEGAHCWNKNHGDAAGDAGDGQGQHHSEKDL